MTSSYIPPFSLLYFDVLRYVYIAIHQVQYIDTAKHNIIVALALMHYDYVRYLDDYLMYQWW